MSIFDKLERKFEKFAIPNFVYILLGGQILSYILVYANPKYGHFFYLQGARVLAGEWWRLLSFLFAPVGDSLIFVAFAWYLIYLYGVALERQWGAFRFQLYILIGYLGTIIVSFLFPSLILKNGHIYVSLFLAFAYRFPNFRLLLFFILPVRIFWLALLAWIGIALSLLLVEVETKVTSALSIINFLLFFRSDIIQTLRLRFHATSHKASRVMQEGRPNHVCAVCGKNENKNPDMDIRYCETCVPTTCYCGDHIKDHAHKKHNRTIQ